MGVGGSFLGPCQSNAREYDPLGQALLGEGQALRELVRIPLVHDGATASSRAAKTSEAASGLHWVRALRGCCQPCGKVAAGEGGVVFCAETGVKQAARAAKSGRTKGNQTSGGLTDVKEQRGAVAGQGCSPSASPQEPGSVKLYSAWLRLLTGAAPAPPSVGATWLRASIPTWGARGTHQTGRSSQKGAACEMARPLEASPMPSNGALATWAAGLPTLGVALMEIISG
ncbi:hypothetical protein PSPO01_05328 [Paraphaeosphaeria sporulosa]